MPNCPICDTESGEDFAKNCSVCSWTFAANLLTGEPISEDIERAILNWARQIWATSQKQAIKLSKGKKANRKKKAKGKKGKGSLSSLSESNLLEIQWEEVQAKLEQASAERAHLQSQLEWVLYRFEQINPEWMTATLSRLEEAIATLPAATPPMSEVGIDYNPLIQLLANGKWQKADELTWAIALKARLREEEGSLTPEDIANFPCTDLCTIDQLWDYYSNGLFGLSTQWRIWESVGQEYTEFCDRVGWRVKSNWNYYEDLSFNVNAPEGHLPVLAWRRRACYGTGTLMAAESFSAFASRLLICKGND